MSSSSTTRTYDLIVLDGQGTAAATSPQTLALALRDAHNPLASAVLAACHHAFLQELNSLSQQDQSTTGLDTSALDSPTTFLSSILAARPNALTANVSLYLTQLLRYVAHLDPASFTSPTTSGRVHALLGFSTGMFAASVIASADSVPSLLSYSVEALRLAFWLGLRAQQYALTALTDATIPLSSPWSLVVFGASRHQLQTSADSFNKENVSRYFISYVSQDAHQ